MKGRSCQFTFCNLGEKNILDNRKISKGSTYHFGVTGVTGVTRSTIAFSISALHGNSFMNPVPLKVLPGLPPDLLYTFEYLLLLIIRNPRGRRQGIITASLNLEHPFYCPMNLDGQCMFPILAFDIPTLLQDRIEGVM